jgi:hypothetical protein
LEVDAPIFTPLIQGMLLLSDRSFHLHLRGCHSLWRRFPTDFNSAKGYSPPHLPSCCQNGIRCDLTGFHSLLLTGSLLISFPPSTKMLHFEGLLRITALSRTPGSTVACTYPGHFVACHAALRAQAQPSTNWRVYSIYGVIKNNALLFCRHFTHFLNLPRSLACATD